VASSASLILPVNSLWLGLVVWLKDPLQETRFMKLNCIGFVMLCFDSMVSIDTIVKVVWDKYGVI
ncbi:MAG: hypothetical protein KAU27_06380, partial [Desulfuromonadales bacterium]|nr:hypothetical protein [Desulfuromonadales bacterium]